MRCFAAGLIALALAGCTTIGTPTAGLPSAPVQLADQTVLDEQAALAVELAYQGAAIGVSIGIDLGVIRGDAAARAATLDRTAYSAVLAVRAAYDAGNADSYAAAAIQARAAIGALLSLLR